jgi:hypothetical protein
MAARTAARLNSAKGGDAGLASSGASVTAGGLRLWMPNAPGCGRAFGRDRRLRLWWPDQLDDLGR